MYTLARNETISVTYARGYAFDVVTDTENMTSIGVVVDGVAGWRVHTAGTGVPVDQAALHASSKEAVAAIVAARTAASEPGGMLHVKDGLTGFQRAVLDFAKQTWTYQGTREIAIWKQFDMSPTRYAQHLLNLLDNPHAQKYAPALIRHERERRDAARARRSLKTATVS